MFFAVTRPVPCLENSPDLTKKSQTTTLSFVLTFTTFDAPVRLLCCEIYIIGKKTLRLCALINCAFKLVPFQVKMPTLVTPHEHYKMPQKNKSPLDWPCEMKICQAFWTFFRKKVFGPFVVDFSAQEYFCPLLVLIYHLFLSHDLLQPERREQGTSTSSVSAADPTFLIPSAVSPAPISFS